VLLRLFAFLFSLLLTLLVLWQLSTPKLFGDKSLPPLGAFFNPFSGFWQNAERAAPFDLSLEAALPGLSGKVEVVFDDLMIPHIFAENLADATMVQGYLTARDRLWQMDLTARKAGGRLSEIMGERTLLMDRLARRKSLVRAAQTALGVWRNSPEDMKVLDAYTAGVNAWIGQLSAATYPIEFKLLDYRPEQWSALKTALVLESMSEMLASKDDDLASVNALDAFGRAAFDSLYPLWNPRQTPIVPDTGQWQSIQRLPAPASATSVRPDHLGMAPPPQSRPDNPEDLSDPYRLGSNNWAVSGRRSQTGHPLLANDPHLMLNLPSIWYQIQIHTPDQNACGVSIPGLPGIIIGFNEDIAWGVTNASIDVSDWYQIRWTDNTRTKYMLDGQAVSTSYDYHIIRVKGKPDVTDTVRSTSFGPVVYDFDPKNPLYNCSLRWGSQDAPPGNILNALPALLHGKTYDDYRNAIAGHDCPGQNFVYASRTGDIAITVQGRFPVRAEQQGRFVQDGSRWENNWHNYIPDQELPALKNPGRGFVYSANQHSTPPSYPYFYLGDFEDYRSRRIFSRLSGEYLLNMDSMKALQLDNYSQRAGDALPAMLSLLDEALLDSRGQTTIRDLKQWDYRYEADAKAPVFFNVWFDSLYVATWDEVRMAEKMKGKMLWPESWRFIEMLQTDTSNRFFDQLQTPVIENARTLVNASFRQAQRYFELHPDKNTGWGAFRGLTIGHLARIPAFSRSNILTGGHPSAPNAQTGSHGPSWRMIVDLGDSIRAIGVYPGGQSGNPGSPYYDNMIDTWAKGQYYDLLFLTRADENNARIVQRHTFLPK
jgi:penicillin amidase